MAGGQAAATGVIARRGFVVVSLAAAALSGCGQGNPIAVNQSGGEPSVPAATTPNVAAPAASLTLTPEQQMRRGLVDMAALRAQVRALGRPDGGGFAALDRDHSGRVSVAEWAAYATTKDRDAADPLGHAVDLFFHFDLNGDSALEPDELDLAESTLGY